MISQKKRRLYFPLLQTTPQNQPSSRGQWYFFAMACSSRPSWDPKRLVKLPMPNFTAFGVRSLIFCGEKREVGLINVGYKYLDSNYEFFKLRNLNQQLVYFQAIWKICSSNWISAGRDENRWYLKPPPSECFGLGGYSLAKQTTI